MTGIDMRILVAGIGNIFKGDDAFGVEVAQRLARRTLPPQVKVVDFGIRGIDLTYALLDGYDTAILVDAAQRGEAPGTVSIVAPDAPSEDAVAPNAAFVEPHNLDPAKVLALVAALGGGCRRVLLVACEPLDLGDEETGAMGLSPPVEAAVDEAVTAIERLVGDLLSAALRSNADSDLGSELGGGMR
jgi:hydrogenase maturation protease